MPLGAPMNRTVRGAALWLPSLLLAVGAAQAQYKVVGPDGSVTYTDRPPAAANAKVTPIGRNAIAAAAAAAAAATNAESSLPLELRTAMQRHPVTLYTGDACTPCDAARRLLQQRGVPFVERRVSSEEDVAALERLTGARSVPSLSIGAQPLRGFNDVDWTSYLDAAGYPKQSRLPRTWQAQPPRPLVERATAAAPAPAAAAEPAAEVAPDAPAGGIRF
jgi:glutaredoxin